MKRRNFLKCSSLVCATGWAVPGMTLAETVYSRREEPAGGDDNRAFWVGLVEKIASPVLLNISRGELRKNMQVVFSPDWGSSNRDVCYMEAFGRLIAGLAPWFGLPEDLTEEGRLRKRLYEQTLKGLENGVNPESPDYFCWGNPKTTQPLVDASYIAHAFIRSPHALWDPLSVVTKRRMVNAFKSLRQITPHQSNWLLFAAMVESFLLYIGEEFDAARIDGAIDSMNKWYMGDGWYGDGPHFHFDHYNGYVIHPMLVDVLKINVAKGRKKQGEYDLAYRRMKRYAEFQERFISPEGTYPIIGRSSTYRLGAFQPLAQLALEDGLPEEIRPAQVRCALTAVMKRMFIPSTFTSEGWLRMGLVGDKQMGIADYYSDTGSMYLTSLVFLPLGLPGAHEFWSGPFTEWTSMKAWNGEPFKKDYAVDY